MSPENPDQPTGDIIRQLFPPDALISAGMAETSTTTFEFQKVRERLHRFQFVVPSPMSSKLGLTQEGKESGRCLGNTGPRRFLVTEFDFKSTNDNGKPTRWASLIDRVASKQRNRARRVCGSNPASEAIRSTRISGFLRR
jgi:hypothetical protein